MKADCQSLGCLDCEECSQRTLSTTLSNRVKAAVLCQRTPFVSFLQTLRYGMFFTETWMGELKIYWAYRWWMWEENPEVTTPIRPINSIRHVSLYKSMVAAVFIPHSSFIYCHWQWTRWVILMDSQRIVQVGHGRSHQPSQSSRIPAGKAFS